MMQPNLAVMLGSFFASEYSKNAGGAV